MNRRTVLRSAGVLATVSLAGCADAVEEYFQGSFRGVVPVEIHSEADRSHNIELVAYELSTNRQTYDQGYSVTPGETVGPPHLEAADQSLRVVRYDGVDEDEEDVREVSITQNTMLVTISIYDDDLVIDVERGEADGDESRNETIDDESETTVDRNETIDNESMAEDNADIDTDADDADADDATADDDTDTESEPDDGESDTGSDQ